MIVLLLKPKLRKRTDKKRKLVVSCCKVMVVFGILTLKNKGRDSYGNDDPIVKKHIYDADE